MGASCTKQEAGCVAISTPRTPYVAPDAQSATQDAGAAAAATNGATGTLDVAGVAHHGDWGVQWDRDGVRGRR